MLNDPCATLLGVQVAAMHQTCRPNRYPVKVKYDRDAIDQNKALREMHSRSKEAAIRAAIFYDALGLGVSVFEALLESTHTDVSATIEAERATLEETAYLYHNRVD